MRRVITAIIVAGAVIPAIAFANEGNATNGGTPDKTETTTRAEKPTCKSSKCEKRVALKKKARKRASCRSTACKRRVALKQRPANYDIWIRIGRCEQPGSGYMGINWSHPGPTYGGGLGIYIGTWNAFKPAGFPATPGQATWRQQMAVANNIYARYGTSAWGCG